MLNLEFIEWSMRNLPRSPSLFQPYPLDGKLFANAFNNEPWINEKIRISAGDRKNDFLFSVPLYESGRKIKIL